MSDYLDPNNEELLKDFFMEAQMQVETLESNILVLENDPTNSDAVDEIFRAAHTLKGAAGTVQMMELAEFTHIVEDVLDEIRNGKIQVKSDEVDILLQSIDVIKAMLEARGDGEVYEEDISELKDQLKGYLSQAEEGGTQQIQDESTSGVGTDSDAAETSKGGAKTGISEYELLELREAAGSSTTIFKVSVSFDKDNPMNTVGGIQVFAALKSMGSVLKTEPDFEELYEDKYFPQVDYYVATEEDTDTIENSIDMPDVVTNIEISEIIASEGQEGPPPQEVSRIKESVSPTEGEAPEKEAVPEAKAEAGPEIETKSEEKVPEAAAKAEQFPEEEKADKTEKKAEKKLGKQGMKGSVLRVDSSRIDNLLNLVSEAVINKATFNQINTQFAEILLELQNTSNHFRERQKEFFESLPDYLEEIQEGKQIKQIKKELMERFGDLYTLYDPFEGNLKDGIAKFRGTAQILGRITGELHERVLQIRMVPISQIFSRFPRLVRDVSRSLHKEIELTIEGEDTELDKSVIEDLLDPLIHIVRNSVDHGVENPEEREKAGKTREGHVLLKASNEGNMIVIEIADDGKGINLEDVHSKAIERGVIHPNKKLSDIEAFNLIFDPGFSTAKEVTNISGRGVGLDVVKRQIEKLNGNVTVWSEQGKGTKMTIKLPLTLAIIQGLLVKVGKEIYAIPITSVLDSHRIKPSDIKMIDNYEVFNVREDVISLLRLNRLFRIPTEEEQKYHYVVVVGSGDKKMGLVVDTLIGEEDVVIKPLKDKYTNSPGIAGATILGDGTVSLIIDVSQLLELGLEQEIEQRKLREASI